MSKDRLAREEEGRLADNLLVEACALLQNSCVDLEALRGLADTTCARSAVQKRLDTVHDLILRITAVLG